MIAYTCSLSDTTTGTVTVQAAPGYSVNPDSINVVLNCGDSITVPLTIYNTGGGDLVFDIEIVFLYPWAVAFDLLGLFGLVEMALFIGTVFVAYAYVWRRGGLEWD